MSHLAARFELPALPFERHSLEPGVSRAQVDLLYSHCHRRHIDALNAALSPEDDRSLAALAEAGDETVRHHAQEAWNLVFFWHGLNARSVDVPGALSRRIDAAFGGVGALQYQWRQQVQSSAGGWSWLVEGPRGELLLATSAPGQAPAGSTPLLAITLAEDAYRIDHAQQRGAYFDALWPHLNWEYAQLNSEVAERAPD
ncbi:Fe-Mn family superoxide dismutase [Salinicola sp. CPA57]|uniref:superoxide dismutase n=1 Tax=Salinicola sp. CPA57 TaxID=1949080 RepID=UPI0018E58E95|nr:Fe-Mn family superoxide dismutase [Salinicola sp. CPA57]